MNAANSAGVQVAGYRPEASALALTAGSERALATSRLSLSMIPVAVPLGATSPSQTVISPSAGTSEVITGKPGTGGKGRGSNLASTRNAPLWISDKDAEGP